MRLTVRQLHDAAPRYWPKVARGVNGECWLWTGAHTANGYGALKVDRRVLYAHRIAWAYAHGRMPPRSGVIRHVCNTEACVNPEHLEHGTQSANLYDQYNGGGRPEAGPAPKPSLDTPR